MTTISILQAFTDPCIRQGKARQDRAKQGETRQGKGDGAFPWCVEMSLHLVVIMSDVSVASVVSLSKVSDSQQT
jgi:hypothetical protein